MTTRKPSSSISAASRRRGFTLVEVVVATAIAGLTVLAVYRIVQTNLQAAMVMEESVRREREVDGFEAMVREWIDGWREPSRVGLVGLPHKFGKLASDELSFLSRGGNGLLSAAAGEGGDYTVTLFHKPDGDSGEVGLRRVREDSRAASSRDWVPVLTKVAGLEIRYYDPVDQEWIDTWNGRSDLPRLMRFRVWLEERSLSTDFVVSIPPRGQSL